MKFLFSTFTLGDICCSRLQVMALNDLEERLPGVQIHNIGAPVRDVERTSFYLRVLDNCPLESGSELEKRVGRMNSVCMREMFPHIVQAEKVMQAGLVKPQPEYMEAYHLFDHIGLPMYDEKLAAFRRAWSTYRFYFRHTF